MSLGGAMVWSIDDDDFANGSPLAAKINGIVNNRQLGPQLPSALLADNASSPQNWMGRLHDALKLSQLNVPGTHESCSRVPQYLYGDLNLAYTLRGNIDCQNSTLEEQLNRGVRYIDIRCRHVQDAFNINHDVYDMGFDFGQGVRDVCVNFVRANPSECIVMQVKHESTDENVTPGRSFQQTFDGYVRGLESFFYLDDHIPTLGEVRGKIVVVRRFNLDGSSPRGLAPLEWKDNATFPANYPAANGEAVSFEIQDQYQLNVIDGGPNLGQLNVTEKWGAIKKLLDQAKSDAGNAWYINEISGTAAPAFGPRNVADFMSPPLSKYLAGAPFPNRLGTLLMDFPDDTLIGKIIGLNMPAAGAPVGLSIIGAA